MQTLWAGGRIHNECCSGFLIRLPNHRLEKDAAEKAAVLLAVALDRETDRMYFWRIEELKRKLLSAPLTERETLPYFIVFLVLMAVVPLFPPANRNVWDYLGIGWTALLGGTGTIYLYCRNGGDAGVHFVQRFFAIGWVGRFDG